MLLYNYVSGITHVVCPEGLKVETLQLGMWDDDVDPMPLHVILLSIVIIIVVQQNALIIRNPQANDVTIISMTYNHCRQTDY